MGQPSGMYDLDDMDAVDAACATYTAASISRETRTGRSAAMAVLLSDGPGNVHAAWLEAAMRRADAVDWPMELDPATGVAVPLTEIRAVPEGWHYFGSLGPLWLVPGITPSPEHSPMMHLLHGVDAWVLMYTNPIAGRGTPGLIDCRRSLGEMYDYFTGLERPNVAAQQALGLIIANHLSVDEEGVALLLRLGNTTLDLPEDCYSPTFGLPDCGESAPAFRRVVNPLPGHRG